MKHVWVVHMRGNYGDTPLFGVFASFKAADREVREMLDGAKYNRAERTWYRDVDYMWYQVEKVEVQV